MPSANGNSQTPATYRDADDYPYTQFEPHPGRYRTDSPGDCHEYICPGGVSHADHRRTHTDIHSHTRSTHRYVYSHASPTA